MTKQVKPAFLGRLKVVPFYPIPDDVLVGIIELKLERIGQRVAANHKASFAYDESLVDAVLARCTEVDSGARNVDNILNGTLLPQVAEVRERMAGWGLRIVQATGYNPALIGDDPARRDVDLDRLTRSFEVAVRLGSPMVLTGCGSYHPMHGDGPHPRNHTAVARARFVEFRRLVAPRAEDHGII